MTVTEAIERLMVFLERHGDDELVIPISEPSVGRAAYMPISGFAGGCEWDKGLFFVVPKEALKRKYPKGGNND